MSNNELAYFYLLDWSGRVLDIREQYPLLDLELAISSAAKAGIKYPADRTSGYPCVLTCDFMITTEQGLKARTIKMSSELSHARVLEKFEIERRYWASQGIDWKFVTENEISFQKAKNIEWLYAAREFSITENTLKALIGAVNMIGRTFSSSELPVALIAEMAEREFALEEGTGLFLFKYLVLNKEIDLDLRVSLNLNKRRVLVRI
jgi:hypothetical protein